MPTPLPNRRRCRRRLSPMSRSCLSRASAPRSLPLSKKELAAVLAGTSARYEALELVKGEADAILAALGVERPADAARLVEAKDATKLAADLAKNRKRLGFLRADVIGPGVRALSWGGKSLFGVDRLTKTAAWTLRARLPAAPAGKGFDASKTWTLVAGGDIMLDRGVAQTLTIKGKGADFPFDGGSAEITSRCKDCSSMGWDLPRTRRTGNAGALRHLVKGADIAIANFENPAPNTFRYHTSGTVFSADPKLIKGLAERRPRLGRPGQQPHRRRRWRRHPPDHQEPRQVRHPLGRSGQEHRGRAHAEHPRRGRGQGRDPRLRHDRRVLQGRCRQPGERQADRRRSSRPTSRRPARPARTSSSSSRTGAANTTRRRSRGQQALARASIDAGADMVIGNHAHWAAAMEVYEGKPIWYALGNFVFDQTWSEPTMEGVTLELTFRGQAARAGPDAAAHHPRQGPAQLHGPGRQRQGGDGPDLRRLEGPAALVAPAGSQPAVRP